jgi:hypothetical protein
MKRGVFFAAVLAFGISCGSDGVGDLVTVAVDVDIERQTIPGLLPVPGVPCEEIIQVLPGLSQPITIDLRGEEELEGEGAIGAFKSVVLDVIRLDIVGVPAGDSDDWDFVDSIRLFADDPATADPPVLVAELDPVPQNITSMEIPGTGVDISDIASAENFTVSGEVSARVPCDEVKFEGEADFDVELF